jgi:hypothetical protein
MSDRETQAQMLAQVEEPTSQLDYTERQIVFGYGGILLSGQTLNEKQEATLRGLCAAHGVEGPSHV